MRISSGGIGCPQAFQNVQAVRNRGIIRRMFPGFCQAVSVILIGYAPAGLSYSGKLAAVRSVVSRKERNDDSGPGIIDLCLYSTYMRMN